MSIVYYENGVKVKEEHVGLVLSLHERGSFMDSYYTDHYAVVWDPDEKISKSINYWCDRNETSHAIATIDAPEDVKVAFEKYKQETHLKIVAQAEIERAAEEARTPRRGKMLVVTRGRKLPHGTSGVCFWAGETRFGRSVGLKLASGEKVFTAERNVKVVR